MPQKLSLEEIKITLKNINKNIIIISDTYDGCTSKLKCKCLIDNHEWNVTWKSLKNGSGCSKCSKNIKLDINTIKNRIKDINKNIEILSSEYVNSKAKLKCKCILDGYIWYANWKNLSQGKGCPLCANKVTLTLKQVQQKFLDKGYIPLFDKYHKTTDMLLVETKEGYKFQTSIDKLNRSENINIFYAYNPYMLENINTYIKIHNINCKLISTKWIDCNSKLIFKCMCGNKFKTNWCEFSKDNSPKQQCNDCGIKHRSGENHYEYNPNLTLKEREIRRLFVNDERIKQWRNSVFERDNYTCKCCGEKSSKGKIVKLRAHHLNGYHWFKEGRFDIHNGITLCDKCHDNKYKNSFHNIYSTKNNTKEQFEEFLQFKKCKNIS